MIKEKTVGQIYKSVIIRNSIFFVFMTAFMFCVLSDNLNNTTNGLVLILFLAVTGSFFDCFFEMRIVRKTGEFLMPTARILMFLYKPIMFILGYVVMILSFKSAMQNYLKYILLLVYIVVATGLFYFFVIMLFRKKDSNEVCYIDYNLSKSARSKNRNSALVGIITTTILLMGVIAFFTVCLVKHKTDQFTIIGYFITTCLLIGCEMFYIQEIVKKIKAEKRAGEAVADKNENKEDDNETTDR